MNIEALLQPFTLKIWVKSDVDQLRRAWTNSDELQRWFLSKASYFDQAGEEVKEAVEGGSYRWEWIEGTSDEAKVIILEDHTLLFGWFSGKGTVKVEFEPQGHETLVRLTQEMREGTPNEILEAQLDCKTGWVFFLTNLKSVFEGGIDLRETEPGRVPVVNY